MRTEGGSEREEDSGLKDAGEDAEGWNVGRKQGLTDGLIKIAAMLYHILLQLNI